MRFLHRSIHVFSVFVIISAAARDSFADHIRIESQTYCLIMVK